MLFHLIIDGEGDIMIHFLLNLIAEMGILQRPSIKMYDSSQNNEKNTLVLTIETVLVIKKW